ncbi:MAG: hypothetical protein RL456_630 [Pseudomonadota bacterium]|jgi:hypothetical protein
MNDNKILSNKAAALALARYPGRPEVARAVSLRIRSQDAPMSVLFGHMIPSQRAADVLVSPEVRQQMVLAKFVDDVASELAAPALNAIPPSPATTEPVAPDSASAPASTPEPVAGTAGAGRPKGIAKSVLVNRHGARWPSIGSDLSDASTNGLAARAKAGKRGWIEVEALAWAEEQGRLLKAPEQDSLSAVMNSVGFTSRTNRLVG